MVRVEYVGGPRDGVTEERECPLPRWAVTHARGAGGGTNAHEYELVQLTPDYVAYVHAGELASATHTGKMLVGGWVVDLDAFYRP